MDKKVLKFYEAPKVEAVDLKLEGFLCSSGDSDLNGGAENVGGEAMGEDEE